ncbi:MAG: hydroxyisourate hydrolase [Phycisphaerales bacterium]|nr:hydroxyisourate hydrolase [Phycisphaerales bacterium]
MGRLTTHVLDTANGKPAPGLHIKLHRWEGGQWNELADLQTNADGRADKPVLDGDALLVGNYRLTFFVGDYFAAIGSADAKKFLDTVPIDFTISDTAAHYHVPLLCSPWAYSTYRGS